MDALVSLTAADLDRFVQRSKRSSALPALPDVAVLLRELLQKAVELIPSTAGVVLLDDPLAKVDDQARNELYAVAAFGPNAAELLGRSASSTAGVAGRAYRTSRSVIGSGAPEDDALGGTMDEVLDQTPRSVLAAPIILGGTACGAIELFDRIEEAEYAPRDVLLLEVFASQASSGIQNALDARHAQELAKIDDLTGLFNDRYLHVRLREELERARESGSACALLFVDLDHFKPINDTYGHLVGSQVIREIGYLLRRVTAEEEAVLARYGGDEFTVLLPDRTAEEASGVAERVREAIASAEFLSRSHSRDLPALRLTGAVTASIGVADTVGLPAGAADTARTLIRLADEAMYAAKSAGKNRVVRVSTA